MYSEALFRIRGRSVAAFTLMYVATLATLPATRRCFVTSHEYIPSPQPLLVFYLNSEFYMSGEMQFIWRNLKFKDHKNKIYLFLFL